MNWHRLRSGTVRALAIAIVVCATTSAVASDVPDLELSWYETAALEPVSIFTVPDGQGHGFDAAFAYGGAVADATITLQLLNSSGYPIAGYTAEDIWLESTAGGLVACPGGTIADADTDTNGLTEWREPLAAGGWTDPNNELTVAMVSGSALAGPGLEITFNSPDISGDGFVNLTDIALMSQDLFGTYHYRADFNWDGLINLSDIAYMTTLGLGSACP